MVNLTVSVYRIKDKLRVLHEPTIIICYIKDATYATGIALPGCVYFKASSMQKER